MAKFTNEAGREFRPRIDVGSLRRVREATGFDLSKLLDDNLSRLHALAGDPVVFAGVLYVLCGDEARAAGEEAFYSGLAGDALTAAWDAFMEAFADFSPSHRRHLLRGMAEKAKQVAELATDYARLKIEAIDPERMFRELADVEKGRTSNDSPTGSPASSGSTPAP